MYLRMVYKEIYDCKTVNSFPRLTLLSTEMFLFESDWLHDWNGKTHEKCVTHPGSTGEPDWSRQLFDNNKENGLTSWLRR